MERKSAYISGPLTELSETTQGQVKNLYKEFADILEEITGVRAFVPHEHFDPIKNAGATPKEVDAFERAQVCERTSLLIVLAFAPSWGGGIEVEMAYREGVPVWLFCEAEKLEKRKISRLLRGNPAIKEIISFTSFEDAKNQLRSYLKSATLNAIQK